MTKEDREIIRQMISDAKREMISEIMNQIMIELEKKNGINT
jgi:hypothetical protein